MSAILGSGANTPTGSVLDQLWVIIETIFGQINEVDLLVVNNAFDYEQAVGSDLEQIALFYGIKRAENRTDAQLRREVELRINSRVPCTIDAIQDVFEIFIGLRPVIVEDFTTRVLTSGEEKSDSETIASFGIHLDVGITLVNEQNKHINLDGNTITVGHTSNINDTGSVGAYHEDDPTHQTNLATSIDADTGLMTVSAGPYEPLTKFDISYEIIPLEDYDTLAELYENIELFNNLVQLIKAGGVRTEDIKLTKFMEAWFQDGGSEVLEVLDDVFGFGLVVDLVQFAEATEAELLFFGVLTPPPINITLAAPIFVGQLKDVFDASIARGFDISKFDIVVVF